MSGVVFYLVAWVAFVALLAASIALGRVYDEEDA